MNKRIIIILTLIFSIGGTSSFLIIRYRSKNQDSLEVKEEEKKEENKVKSKEKKEEFKSEEKETKEESESKEEIIDIPWTYTWKGEVCSLSTSVIISLIIGLFMSNNVKKKMINLLYF